MKIAVIQHRLRPAPAQDLEALVLAASGAAAQGADVVVLPHVAALSDGPLSDELARRLGDEVRAVSIIAGADERGRDDAGGILVITGDDCMDGAVLASAAAEGPDILVMAPGSESDLQAEAVLELAIGLSTSVAALVVIVESDGAEAGMPGHGGSAIVHLGEILGEALSGDDVLAADITTPIGRPEPRSQVPAVPPLLAGRLAAHAGRKLDVDYPADLG